MKKSNLIIVVITIVVIISIISFWKISLKEEEATDLSEFKQITLRLQWHTQTQFAGYYVALSKGFYEEVGLAVNIEQGGYGKNCINTVKEGIEEFGTKWMADLTISDNSLISLANIVKDNGLMLISKKDKNISSISDFYGKKVSIWFIGNEYQLFALLDKNQILHSELSIVSQKWDLTQFYNDEVDVFATMSYNEFLTVQKNGYSQKDLNIFSFKENGVGFPGQNIFTSKSFYNENPDICRKFVQASIKGWEFAVKNPAKATEIVMSFDKGNLLEFDHQLLQMKEIIRLMQTDSYKIGLHLEKDYNFIEETFKKYKIIKNDLKIHTLYTNEFISE